MPILSERIVLSTLDLGLPYPDEGRIIKRDKYDLNVTQNGTRLSVVDNPKGDGKVLLTTVFGEPVFQGNNPNLLDYRRRGYPPIIDFRKLIPGTFSVEYDVLVNGISPALERMRKNGPWISTASVFDMRQPEYHAAIVIVVDIIGGKMYSRLYIPDTGWQNLYPNAPEFKFDEWTTIKIVTDRDKNVTVFQDGVPVSYGRLSPQTQLGIWSVNTGLYSGPIQSGNVYNKMLNINIYPISP